MKVVAIVQARCSSTRLPNKVLKKILGKPMLQQQIERIQRSRLIDKLVIATSTKTEDEGIVDLCRQLNVSCFTGSLNNVLERYYRAAGEYKADVIVRLTGDCPLTDAAVIDQVIKKHLNSNNDYTSNIDPETFPDGLDVEVFNYKTLQQAELKAKKPSELEHVTPYIRNNKEFIKGSLQSSQNYSQYRWTVDEPEDLEFVTQIYQQLGSTGQYFDADKIYQLLEEHPELLTINQNLIRNEGLLNSLKEDKLQEN
ncbi:cytidylyltransferase domain-containing protein [Psychromonas ossibalaenae]|uniref:cytidylyltransferase domain-containing protein n=1 Tax=Psychromonas ossibalaenae TaxID=444922 RepID=UPI00036F4072|nr:glycosyltransferase family protein [Psychromonas ossibalaenae]